MSDYIENLVIRTAGVGKGILVQPRLPSRYEALPPTPDLAGRASPSAQAANVSEGAEPHAAAKISPLSMPFPDSAGRTAGMSAPQELPFPPPEETEPQSFRSFRRRVIPEAKVNKRAEVRLTGSPPSEADRAAKKDDLQRDAILPPLDRDAPAVPAFPGADGSTERQSTFLSVTATPEERGPRPMDLTELPLPERSGLSEPAEPESERMAESHPCEVSRPDQAKVRESGNQSRIKPDPGAPNAYPSLAVMARRWKASFEEAAVQSTGGRFEVGQGEKNGLPESGRIFPVPSPRPSLRAQGPVLRFSPPAGSRQGDADEAAPSATGGEQPPVVRVSIGRVEVRAIMPAAPAEKAASPKPRMSLDEYLRQQNEAKR